MAHSEKQEEEVLFCVRDVGGNVFDLGRLFVVVAAAAIGGVDVFCAK